MSVEPQPDRFERWVLPYLRDSALWPVLLVLLAHAALIVAPFLLLAFRDRDLRGLVGCAVFTGATLHGLRLASRNGHLRPTAGLLLATWVLSAATAWFGARWQIL